MEEREYLINLDMKLLLITNNINQIGGVERVISILANKFSSSLNYNVEIVSLNSENTNTFFEFNNKIKISHYGIKPEYSKSIIERLKIEKRFTKNIRDILEDKEYDIIMTFHSHISKAILDNKKYLKGKVVATEHLNYSNFTMIRKIINIITFRKADKLVVLTEYDKSMYSKFLKNVEVIPNAVPFSTNKISNQDKKRIIAIGRLEYVKGFDYLIDIFNLVQNKHFDWTLTIIGCGSEQKNLEKRIKEYKLNNSIEILPFTNNVQTELLNSLIYTLTSRQEGFGLVLIEAMECGLPIVSFDIPASKEIISNRVDGILVPQGDIQEFANQLSKLMYDYEKRKAYGQNAKNNAERYHINNISNQWEKLFRSIL